MIGLPVRPPRDRITPMNTEDRQPGWYVPSESDEKDFTGWGIGKLQSMFMDRRGFPLILTTEKQFRLHKKRLDETIPVVAVALKAYHEHVTVTEYLRRVLLEKAEMQSRRKTK